MRFALLIIIAISPFASAQNQDVEVEWIWKNDPILSKLNTGHDFGLKLVDGKLTYDILYEKEEKANALVHPLRIINGKFIDMSERFKEIELGNLLSNIYKRTRQRPYGIIQPKSPEWVYRNFQIMQVIPGEGFLGVKGTGHGEREGGPFFIHAPHIKDKVDNDWMRGYFIKQGVYQYETTQGAIKTVRKYIYGTIPEGEKLKEGVEWLKKKYTTPE